MPALSRAGIDATGLDVAPGASGNRSITCDLTDPGSVREALAGLDFDAVIHLAAASRVAPGAEALRIASSGTGNLTAALEGWAGPGRTFVLAGSSAVYGAVPASEMPVDEARPPAPAGSYGEAHLERERIVLERLGGSGARVIVIRMFNLVGPGQEPVMLVPQAARRLALEEAGAPPGPLAHGSLDPRRDYVDVRDAAAAFVRALTGGPQGSFTVNISTGHSRSGREVLESLCALFGRPFPGPSDPAPPPAPPGSVMDLRGATGRASRLLGWQPSIRFGTSLADVASDWRARVSRGSA